MAALAGAGVTGVVAIAVQVLGGLTSSRSSGREARSDRFTEYLAGTLGDPLAIGQVARAPSGQKAQMERELVWPFMHGSNNALTAIELHDATEQVAAGQAFDRAIVDVMGLPAITNTTRPGRRDERQVVLDERLAEVKRVGRRHVRGRSSGQTR